MTVNEIVAYNVKYLADKNKKKIGDVERQAGVCAGYFSRIRANNSDISLKVALKTAEVLNVSIDELCSDIKLKDLQKMASECGYKLIPIDTEG